MESFGQGNPGKFILDCQKQDDNSFLVEVNFDRDHAESIRKKYFKSKKKHINMSKFPGFRQGKLPFGVFEKRFGKEELDGFYAEHFSMLANQILTDEAPNKILITNNAKVESQQNGWWKVDFQAWFEEDVTVPDDFCDSIELDVKLVKVDDYVDNRIRSFARLNPYLWRKTTDDGDPLPAEEGDMVEASIECWVDDEKYEPGCVDNTNVRLIPGAVRPVEAYDGFIGKKENDEFSVKSRDVPQSYIKDLAGKEIELKIKVNHVFTCGEPEIDDDLAITAGFDNLEHWKKYLHDAGERWAKAQNETAHRIAICDYVDNNLEMEDYPDAWAIQKAIEFITARGAVQSAEQLVRDVKQLGRQVTKMKAIGNHFGIEWDDKDKSIYQRDENFYANKVIKFLTDKAKFNYVDTESTGDSREDRSDSGEEGPTTPDREELGTELQDQVSRGGEQESVPGVSEDASISVQEGDRP